MECWERASKLEKLEKLGKLLATGLIDSGTDTTKGLASFCFNCIATASQIDGRRILSCNDAYENTA